MGVYFKLDGNQIANALEAIGWQSGSGGDASVTYANEAPLTPSNGNLWYDTTEERLKIYNGGVWAIISMTQEEMQSITTTVDNMAGYLSTAELQATTATEQANIATTKANEIQAMSATATTLAEGASATALYQDGVLTIGVPRGATGAKGDKGDTGDAGYTPIKGVDYFDGLDSALQSVAGRTGDVVLTEADITDLDKYTKAEVDSALASAVSTATTLTAETTADLDLATDDVIKLTVTADTTFTFSNIPTVAVWTVELSGGGDYTLTFPASVKWEGGEAPTLTSDIDVLQFYTSSGGTSIYAKALFLGIA